MAEHDGTESSAPTERAPLGSWARLYALVCALAIVVMLLLYWFASAFNLPLGN